jgi:hypothetical protein
MSTNPYESPRHVESKSSQPIGIVNIIAIWAWSIVMSFAALFVAGGLAGIVGVTLGDMANPPPATPTAIAEPRSDGYQTATVPAEVAAAG